MHTQSFVIWNEYTKKKANIGAPHIIDEEEWGYREGSIWANDKFTNWGEYFEAKIQENADAAEEQRLKQQQREIRNGGSGTLNNISAKYSKRGRTGEYTW